MTFMKTLQSFKFRLCPTPEQDISLSRHAGGIRFVGNKAQGLKTRRLDAGIPLLSSGDIAKLLPCVGKARSQAFLPRPGPSPATGPQKSRPGDPGGAGQEEFEAISPGSRERERGIPSATRTPSRSSLTLRPGIRRDEISCPGSLF
ncbi:MAG: helix-turn-helix domain-containing protein [Leptospirillia bacterium]